MPEIHVQQLASGDAPLFRDVLELFATAFDEVDNDAKTSPTDAYLEALLASDTFVLLAALRGSHVIGALTAYELRKYEQPRSEIYIYDLAVAEAHRRQGVATDLIEHLKPVARARGAHVIFVQADPADLPAVALYTKLGLREDVHHFDIAVTDRS